MKIKFLFSPPSVDNLIRLLKAWRFWVLGMLVGALLGAAVYQMAPPPYRAKATVNVDFNMEEAWPNETDREQFYYLDRETRKLEEIAWSDPVIQAVARASGVSVSELRGGVLRLGQPAEAGWHFYADEHDPQRAVSLASAWALAFTEQAQAEIASEAGISSLIRLDATQVENLPVSRGVSRSVYLLAGAVGFLVLSVLFILFFGGAGRMDNLSYGKR